MNVRRGRKILLALFSSLPLLLPRSWQHIRPNKAANNDEQIWPEVDGRPQGPRIVDAVDVEGKHNVADDEVAPQNLSVQTDEKSRGLEEGS